MKKTILVFVLALFCSLSVYSQKPNIGGGIEFNYMVGHFNAIVRGEIPVSKRGFIVMKVGTHVQSTTYTMSAGYQRMIYLHKKLPMWLGMNITRDLHLTDDLGSSDLFAGGIEIPVGIQYNFSSGVAPYVEIGYGTFLSDPNQRENRGYNFRMKVGAKYSFGKD